WGFHKIVNIHNVNFTYPDRNAVLITDDGFRSKPVIPTFYTVRINLNTCLSAIFNVNFCVIKLRNNLRILVYELCGGGNRIKLRI
ncbi:TPA: hypothetical protein ACJOGM_000374, partial [Vibrio cholerae]